MPETSSPPTTPIPPEYAALVDDAATFPPTSLSLEEAVREHGEHLASAYAGLVGPFVVSDVALPDLLELLRAAGASQGAAGQPPLRVTVVVSGGAGAIEPAARWATGSPLLELCGLEVALRDPDELAGNARRVVAAADLGLDVPVYVEPPLIRGAPSHGWLAALDELATADLRLKLRTGGASADMVPSAGELAMAIDAALDRELAFRCTGGLRRAVRRRADDTAVGHHGFLNVLLATRAALDGEDAVAALEEQDAAAVLGRLRETGSDGLTRARRWFSSFGCDVRGPLGELVDLGLVTL